MSRALPQALHGIGVGTAQLIVGATYQEAHRVVDEKYNWQKSGPLNRREDCEEEW